jgi:hypothetical protein
MVAVRFPDKVKTVVLAGAPIDAGGAGIKAHDAFVFAALDHSAARA